VRLADWFDPAAVAANDGYRRGLWLLSVVALVVTPVVAVVVAALGGRWRPVVVRAAGARPWGAGALMGAGAAVVFAVVSLPPAFARYVWAREHGVVRQTVLSWAADRGVMTLIDMAVFALVGALAAIALVRLVRTWWLALAGVVAAVTIVILLASPVVVEPLFQRTEPLRDPSLRADVLELAHRAGVDAGEVLVNDAGSRTAGANAYVSGFGATRRIVLYDTLVKGFRAGRSAWWWRTNWPTCARATC